VESGFSNIGPSTGVTASGRWWRFRSLLDGELVELLAPSGSAILSEDRNSFRMAATTFSFDFVDMVKISCRYFTRSRYSAFKTCLFVRDFQDYISMKL